jgi:hypothetical protein
MKRGKGKQGGGAGRKTGNTAQGSFLQWMRLCEGRYFFR